MTGGDRGGKRLLQARQFLAHRGQRLARLLRERRVILPRRDTIWTAVVDAAEMYSRLTRGWEANEFGIDMSAARDLVVNAWARGRISEDQLLAPPRRCAGVDYANIDDPDVEMNVEWVIARAGVGHVQPLPPECRRDGLRERDVAASTEHVLAPLAQLVDVYERCARQIVSFLSGTD